MWGLPFSFSAYFVGNLYRLIAPSATAKIQRREAKDNNSIGGPTTHRQQQAWQGSDEGGGLGALVHCQRESRLLALLPVSLVCLGK
ncbi:hypothetical protein D3C87_1182000 [compost metagenome]